MKRRKQVSLPEEEQSVGEFIQTTFSGPVIKNANGFIALKNYYGGPKTQAIQGKSMKDLIVKLVLSDN